MKHDPIARFCHLWEIAVQDTPLKQKSAVCISTINSEGFPEGRFVDLKEVSNSGFLFCSYLNSNKGNQISANSKVAMTVWWDHLGYQIRVVGNAKQAPLQIAERHWKNRSKDAQTATTCFKQSCPIDSEEKMKEQFENTKKELKGKHVPKPENWGGYIISPISIEVLTFKKSRLHLREFYKLENDTWSLTLLQP
jgi:pyridoxamine 5'-phosphate oxidase